MFRHMPDMPHLITGKLRQFCRFVTLVPSTVRSSTTAAPNPTRPRLIDKPIDEETLPSYKATDFHPTGPGQLLHGTYQTITKIGYGAGSTVWLAEDVSGTGNKAENPQIVAVKVATIGQAAARAAMREVELARVVASKSNSHPGTRIIRTPIESFQMSGPHGQHTCLVYLPLRETLFKFQGRLGRRRLPRPLVKLYAAYFLQALDFLHTECNLIHTDLKDDNILMTLESDFVLKDFVHSQRSISLPRHVREDGTAVFLSQSDLGPLQGYNIIPRLADFDLAFPVMPNGQLHIHPAVQPARYRAPEVVLGTGWSCSADIWNLGLMMWNLLEDINMFNGLFDSDGHYDARVHLAQMISLLGPPPKELLQRELQYRDLAFDKPVLNPRGQMANTVCEYWGGPFFDSNGEFLHKDLIQRNRTLEDTVTELEGAEKDQFLTSRIVCSNGFRRKEELLSNCWNIHLFFHWRKRSNSNYKSLRRLKEELATSVAFFTVQWWIYFQSSFIDETWTLSYKEITSIV